MYRGKHPLVCSPCDQTLRHYCFGQRGEGTQIAVFRQDLEKLCFWPQWWVWEILKLEAAVGLRLRCPLDFGLEQCFLEYVEQSSMEKQKFGILQIPIFEVYSVIELSPPDPSGAIRMIFHRLQENPWRARHFLGVTILISTEAKCLAPEYFNRFQEKRDF